MRTSGEKVRISDEAARVQSFSYPPMISLWGLYTVYNVIVKKLVKQGLELIV